MSSSKGYYVHPDQGHLCITTTLCDVCGTEKRCLSMIDYEGYPAADVCQECITALFIAAEGKE